MAKNQADKDEHKVEPEGLFSLESLQARFRVRSSVHQGVMAAQGWKPGRQVRETEYKQAVDKFLGQLINGKEVKADVKRR